MKTNKILFVALPLMVAGIATGQDIHARLNGQMVRFAGVQPMMSNGRVLVPLRGIFEQMGCTVNWDPNAQSIDASNDFGRHVHMHVGDQFATVDGNDIPLDSPAIMVRGRTMVPLRFISESMGAQVNWNEYEHTASITTQVANEPPTSGVSEQPLATSVLLPSNTVIPFKLNQALSSGQSTVGQAFSGTINTDNAHDYVGLPAGTIVRGHVDAVRPQTSNTPGVLSLAFDTIQLPNGETQRIDGSLMGLDSKSIENSNGRMVAREPGKKNMKYVGIGAGAGALLAIVTKSNVLTTAVIGAAIGYLYDNSNQKPVQQSEVTLPRGTEFGVMLNSDQRFRVYKAN